MRILTVVGARPQFIKAAPLSRALATAGIEEDLLDTGQHYDDSMSRAFFRELGLPDPKISLRVGSDSHGRMTARMLEGIENALLDRRSDMVLVYGDTNSTLAGALAGAKLAIPVAHVEAGLRSFRPKMPEEINRRLTDHCSTYLFCPTQAALRQLQKEDLVPPDARTTLLSLEACNDAAVLENSHAFNVGDVMVDSLRAIQHSNAAQPPAVDLPAGDYALVTLHRAENTDDCATLVGLIDQICELATALPVVFPVHPRTRHALERIGAWQSVSLAAGVHITDPLAYGAFVFAQEHARVVVTDSGGVQKEAAIIGVPCITLRHETEWTETVESGWNRLVGANPDSLVEIVLSARAPASRAEKLFGDGMAAQRIAAILSHTHD